MEDTANAPPYAAALDLGSNTFHLLLADWDSSGWRPRLRRGCVVGLAEPAAGSRELTRAAMERGWDCLTELAPVVRGATALRVVGTQALRAAANRDCFVARAEAILQRPIEVIDGAEEARLIWLGVATEAGGDRERERIVADIGGGSTELIRGRGDRITALASVPLGCLALRAAFGDGRLDDSLLRRVATQARERFAAGAGQLAVAEGVGCSGTLLAIGAVLAALGYPAGVIERDGLDLLRAELRRCRHLDAVDFPSLCDRRRPLFVTGVLIAGALFDALGLERLTLTERALREGVMEQMWRAACLKMSFDSRCQPRPRISAA